MTSSPRVAIPEGSAIAKFGTPDGEHYRVLFDGEAADVARLLLAGGKGPRIPNGLVQPGDGGVNLGHDWPVTNVEIANLAIEVCDGTVFCPGNLGYQGYVAQHGDRYRPGDAELVDLIEG